MKRNPLGPRWALNTIRWLETGPYAHVPAVRRLADELRGFEGPRTADEYRALRAEIERVFTALERRGQLAPEDDPAAITKALLEGSLGLAESGVARVMPGERHGERRPLVQRHPQATERQRRMEGGWARLGAATEEAAERVAQTARQLTARPEDDPLIKEWNLGYDLDGGGYSFERVRGTPLGTALEILLHEEGLPLESARRLVDGLIAWDSPDLDYIIGGDVMPPSDIHRGRAQADLLLIAPGRAAAGTPWPDKIPEPDAEGNLGSLMFELRAKGEVYETTRQCFECESVLTAGRTCPRCEGGGYVVSPGGAYAIYERVEIEREDEDEDEILAVDIDNDEHEMLSRWYGGQGDPLYKLLSSSSIDRRSIDGATTNLQHVIDETNERLSTEHDEDADEDEDYDELRADAFAADALIAKLRSL